MGKRDKKEVAAARSQGKEEGAVQGGSRDVAHACTPVVISVKSRWQTTLSEIISAEYARARSIEAKLAASHAS